LWVLSKNDKKGEKEAEKGQEKEEEAKKTLFDFFFFCLGSQQKCGTWEGK
jgi:hypothetical protein